MAFEDIYLVSHDLVTVDPGKIVALEKELNIKVPPGYSEFMTTLGFGEYCSSVVVYPPQEILIQYKSAQRDWQDDYFWNAGEKVLSKQEVLESIIFGNSVDGDQLIFYPSKPDKLFVLPRHDDYIYWIPSAFFEPLEWYSPQIGQVFALPSFKFFTPYHNRGYITFSSVKENMKVTEVAEALTRPFDSSSVRWFEAREGLIMVFLSSVGGQIHISGRNGQSKANYIRIEYDITHLDEIKLIAKELVDLNFEIKEQHPII